MRLPMTSPHKAGHYAVQYSLLVVVTLILGQLFQGGPMALGLMCRDWQNQDFECQDTCCCNQPQCCYCNTSPTSNLTFIPCQGQQPVAVVTPVNPWPSLANNYERTAPLYEECPGFASNPVSTTPGNMHQTSATLASGLTSSSSSLTQSSNRGSLSSTSPGSPPNQEASKSGSEGDDNSLNMALIGLVAVLALLLLVIIVVLIKKKKRKGAKISADYPRPMTPGPRATFLRINEDKTKMDPH